MPSDHYYMARALALAESGLGRTSPNPAVGCVIVRGGEVVGEGYHPAAGEPHAEIFALEAAGADARGSTVYVTLEPCSTHGRTPPCTDRLIESGVAEVVYGTIDPDPRSRGAGVAALERAGVPVRQAGDEAGLRTMNRGFFSVMEKGRPFVSAKIAVTLDGALTLRRGARAKLTGGDADTWVHGWRAAADAILIGVGTALIDDPLLTARPPEGVRRQPLRTVLDTRGRLPLEGRLAASAADAPLCVITSDSSDPSWRGCLSSSGAEVVTVPTRNGRVQPASALEALRDRGVLEVVAEPGPTLLASLVGEGLIDELHIIVTPLLADDEAPRWTAGLDGIRLIAPCEAYSPDPIVEPIDADTTTRWPMLAVERLGEDLRLTVAPRGRAGGRPATQGG